MCGVVDSSARIRLASRSRFAICVVGSGVRSNILFLGVCLGLGRVLCCILCIKCAKGRCFWRNNEKNSKFYMFKMKSFVGTIF